jgi:hypothetical protein
LYTLNPGSVKGDIARWRRKTEVMTEVLFIGRLKPGKKEDKNEVTEPVFHCAKL